MRYLQVIDDARRKLLSRGATISMIHVHNPASTQQAENGYFKLSNHFHWAIRKAFMLSKEDKSVNEVKRVIILEEDLEVIRVRWLFL
jgi:hypothetical protein